MTSTAPPVGGVLCAGFGTRMAPITDAIPKPLIPFLNSPLLGYALDHLATAGVTQVGMNLHHLADSIPPVADRMAATMNLDPAYAREWEILGTAGGIRGIWNGLDEPDSTLIVFNGDSVMNIEPLELLEAHRRSDARVTLLVRRRRPEDPGGVFVDEEQQSLAGLLDARHPEGIDDPSEYLFCGVHFIEPELVEEIPLEKGCIVQDVYMPLLEQGEDINVEITDDFWAGLDNPRLLFETSRRVLEEPELFDQVPLPRPHGEDLFIFSGQGIDDKTQMAGPILTGPHVETAPGVHVGPNAVVDGVELVEGAAVRDAIVYGMGRVEGQWNRCVAIAGKVANVPRRDDEAVATDDSDGESDAGKSDDGDDDDKCADDDDDREAFDEVDPQ